MQTFDFIALIKSGMVCRVMFRATRYTTNTRLAGMLVAAFFFVSHPCFAKRFSCKDILYQEVKKTFQIHGENLSEHFIRNSINVFLTPARIVFYPVAGPGKLLYKSFRLIHQEHSLRMLWKASVQTLREDYLLILLFLALLKSQEDQFIEASRFDAATAAFDKSNSPDDLLVVAESFDEDDMHYGMYEAKMESQYALFKRKRFIRVRSYNDLLMKLSEIYKEEGKISRLYIETHGAPGLLGFLQKGTEENPYINIQNFPAHLEQVFTENAQIRIGACSAAQGNKGEQLMNDVAATMLDHGGTIYASTVDIISTSNIAYKWHLGDSARWLIETATIGWDSLDSLDDRLIYHDHSKAISGEPKVKIKHYAPWH